MRRPTGVLAWVLAIAFFASSCTGGGGERATPSSSPELWRGGTLRVGLTVDLPSWWDPQQSYYTTPFEIFRCCLLRTLFSYSGRPAEEGGDVLRPDLASAVPEPAPDGLTWTFHLKTGIRYAPPYAGTEIVAADIVRAVTREADPDVTVPGPFIGGYPQYFSVIPGFDDVRAGRAATITGLETPDPHTLIVRLTEPMVDLPYLFAMPATAPIPLGAASGHDGDYDQFLVASGPYMIDGSEDLDFSRPPDEQEPVSGYTPSTFHQDPNRTIDEPGSMTLVRNPSWTPDTDPLRGAYVDRIELRVFKGAFPDPSRLIPLIDRGKLDVLLPVFLSKTIQRARSDPEYRERLLEVEGIYVNPLSMNLARAPFDDVHVRRAVAYAMDREAFVRIVRTVGVPGFEVATHVAPNALVGELLSSYDPFLNHGGDLVAARREMALSRYDHDRDGRCDDPACRAIPVLGAAVGPSGQDYGEASLVHRDLKPIGLDLDLRFVPRLHFFEDAKSGRFAIAVNAFEMSWGPDWPTGTSFFTPVFGGSSIGDDPDSFNTTLMGATSDHLRALDLEPVQVPSVDDRIARCSALTDSAQEGCWAGLDQYLMEEIVPIVPLWREVVVRLVSPRVTHASMDASNVEVALDRVALVPGSE